MSSLLLNDYDTTDELNVGKQNSPTFRRLEHKNESSIVPFQCLIIVGHERELPASNNHKTKRRRAVETWARKSGAERGDGVQNIANATTGNVLRKSAKPGAHTKIGTRHLHEYLTLAGANLTN